MTDREAIVAFEKQLHSAQVALDSGFGTHPGESDSLYRRHKEMAEAALSALQEREERSKGCEWCKDLANPHWRGQHLALIEGDSFCRKCGRKLKTDRSEQGNMK